MIAEMDETRFPFTSFPEGWYRVGWSKDLQAGAVFALHYFGKDLVLFRTESGIACVFDAHCPHLGAHLGYGGKVIGEYIQCPFHGWCLDKSGECAQIPYSKSAPGKAKTKKWPVDEVNGVIYVYYSHTDSQPGWHIPKLDEYLSSEWTTFKPGAKWRIKTHLQELGENGMDKAHFSFLHPQQTRLMRSESTEQQGHIFIHRTFQYYNVFGLARLFIDEVSGPLDLTLYGMGMAVNRTCVNARIKLYYTFVFFFTPVDAEHTEVTCMLTMKKIGGPLITHLLMNKAIKEGKKTIDQDVPIWENKIYREKPVLCDGDGPIILYRRWANQFYHEKN